MDLKVFQSAFQVKDQTSTLDLKKSIYRLFLVIGKNSHKSELKVIEFCQSINSKTLQYDTNSIHFSNP